MGTQLRNNGKQFYPIKKLVIGIFLFASFYGLYEITGGTNGLADFRFHLEKDTFQILNKDIASILSNLIMIAVGIIMIYCFVSGLYRICTFNRYNPVFEENTPGGVSVKGSNVYPNINRILSYRESKMCSMSSERSAELYVSSSKIESLYTGYNAGPETQRTLSYIESKLSGMSSDRGLNYLANKL